MKPEEFDNFGFTEELGSSHRDKGFAVIQAETNAEPEDDGRTDFMSVRFTFAESPEGLRKREFKQIRFWFYRSEAAKISKGIYEAATARDLLN